MKNIISRKFILPIILAVGGVLTEVIDYLTGFLTLYAGELETVGLTPKTITAIKLVMILVTAIIFHFKNKKRVAENSKNAE